jgi:sugar phosphate isomerase/epimerase
MRGDVRLGSPLRQDWDSPEGWIATVRRHGFRTAHWPLEDDASPDAVRAYADAAREADVVIAEIGCWSNTISPDDATREAALELCKARLALADEVGARCCVTVAGSRGRGRDEPHPDNLSEATFALVVDTVREIVDAVGPRRTFFTLEPMPWSVPDSPDAYLALLHAVDRPGFAVHLDPVNLVNTPGKYFGSAAFLRECFAKLGPYVRSVHAKDIVLGEELTVHLDEVRPGLGTLDYRVFLTEMEKLDPDTPILVEHLTEDEEYAAAVAHIRGVAGELGLAV